MKPQTFSVQCVAEIDQHIGTSQAHIVGDSPTNWYIECITNKWGGERSGESVSQGLYEQIEAEVAEYFQTLEQR